MSIEFGHERLAEPHDFSVGAAPRIEIRATLAAADRQSSESILEDLLETQELHDPDIDRRVEAQAALIRPQRRVELDAESAIDADHVLVVHPGYAKDDLALRLADALDQGIVRIFGMLGDYPAQALQHLLDRLQEFGFAGISPEHVIKDGLQFFV